MKKLLLFIATIGLVFVGASSVDAAAKIEHPEYFKVTRRGNQEALEGIKEIEKRTGLKIDLSHAPVSPENITTQEVPEAAKGEQKKTEKFDISLKERFRPYGIDGLANMGTYIGIQTNELVPVNYNPYSNSIPLESVYRFSHLGYALWLY